MVYSFFRNLGYSDYDHAAVVLDDEYCLHISYPRAKKVQTCKFTHILRQPLVLRPKFETPKERDNFLNGLQSEALGKDYDFYRVVSVLFSIHVYNVGKYNDKKTNKIVCSHTIFKELRNAILGFGEKADKHLMLDYHRYGTFSI